MQLRKPEAFGMLDHHDAGVGDVDAHFDDRGGDQDLDFVVGKIRHHLVFGSRRHRAMQQADLGLLNGWLRNIRDVYRLHSAELEAIEDEDARYNRLVELNVQEQCINVIKTAVVQKAYGSKGFPTVHGWVYDLKNGYLVDLNIDFDNILKDIQKIYTIA